MYLDDFLEIHGVNTPKDATPKRKRPRNPKAHIEEQKRLMREEREMRPIIKKPLICHLVGKNTVRNFTSTEERICKYRKRSRGVVSYNPKYTLIDGHLGTGYDRNKDLL